MCHSEPSLFIGFPFLDWGCSGGYPETCRSQACGKPCSGFVFRPTALIRGSFKVDWRPVCLIVEQFIQWSRPAVNITSAVNQIQKENKKQPSRVQAFVSRPVIYTTPTHPFLTTNEWLMRFENYKGDWLGVKAIAGKTNQNTDHANKIKGQMKTACFYHVNFGKTSRKCHPPFIFLEKRSAKCLIAFASQTMLCTPVGNLLIYKNIGQHLELD